MRMLGQRDWAGKALLATATVALMATIALQGVVSAAAPTDKEVDEALTTFHKAYTSKDESDRLQAIETVGSVQSKRVVDALASALLKDSIPAVKRAAAKALGGQWALTAVPALAKALNTADERANDVNSAIIAALGETNSDAAVPVLTSLLLVHRTPRTRGNAPPPTPAADAPPDGSIYDLPALKALGKIASPAALNDVMDFLGKQGAGSKSKRGGGGNTTDPIAGEAERVLEAITGTKQSGILNWRKWWTDNQPKIKVIQVERCEQSGETWEKSPTVTKCATCGDKGGHCSVFLKTKLEGGGHPPAAPSEHKKSSKGAGGSNGE